LLQTPFFSHSPKIQWLNYSRSDLYLYLPSISGSADPQSQPHTPRAARADSSIPPVVRKSRRGRKPRRRERRIRDGVPRALPEPTDSFAGFWRPSPTTCATPPVRGAGWISRAAAAAERAGRCSAAPHHTTPPSPSPPPSDTARRSPRPPPRSASVAPPCGGGPLPCEGGSLGGESRMRHGATCAATMSRAAQRRPAWPPTRPSRRWRWGMVSSAATPALSSSLALPLACCSCVWSTATVDWSPSAGDGHTTAPSTAAQPLNGALGSCPPRCGTGCHLRLRRYNLRLPCN
jgi:hypothetical protein